MKDLVISIFAYILRCTLGVWLKLAYNIKGYNEKVKSLNAPYVLVGNHCLNWDPFMMGIYIKYNTRFISSDHLFRSKILGFLLTNLVGAISKKKSVSDLKTIKLSIKAIKRGRVIGVFPEANRTWNGRSIDILYSTAKFVKLLKVPVVICIMKGGYLSRPRWSVRGRRGVIELHYDILLTKDEVKTKKVEEIHEIMNNAISYNEYDWQKEKMQFYKSKKPAEFLENYIYICPECKKTGTLESKGYIFYCNNCGLKHTIDNYGFFTDKERKFNNPQEWGDWQFEYFKVLAGKSECIFNDMNAVLYSENEKGRLFIAGKGKLSLYRNKLVYGTKESNRVFTIKDIFGNTIQLNCIFEFFYKGEFVRFRFLPKNKASAFKWNQAVDYIKKLEEN